MRDHAPDPIRVFLIDTSALAATLLKRALTQAESIQIVGISHRTSAALDAIIEQDPHVVCMSLHLPGGRGVTLVQTIMTRFPRPILIIGTALREGDDTTVFRLFEAGALDLFLEPSTWHTPGDTYFSRDLIRKIRLLARMDTLPPLPDLPQQTRINTAVPVRALSTIHMIVIGAGLGGINALREILEILPVDFPVPILCIIHIHAALQPFLIRWLSNFTAMPVQHGTHGEIPMAGSIYLPPPGSHLLVDVHGRLATSTPPDARIISYGGGVPSIAVAMESAASHFTSMVVGILLSGTGEDGARGLEVIAHTGGYTLALDEPSAMAFDLPARLLEIGAVNHLLPCSVMGRALLILAGCIPQDPPPPCHNTHNSPAHAPHSIEPPHATDAHPTRPDGPVPATPRPAPRSPVGDALLVVEDSPTQAFKLKRFLKESGFVVEVARHGVEGLEMARTLRPRLILSDVSMPHMDGFGLCRALKQDPQLRAIPIMLLTALTNPEEILEGLSSGADNYLTKPWEPTSLMARIQALLAIPDHAASREEATQITFADRTYAITSSRHQILDLLMTTYHKAVTQNRALMDTHLELKMLNSRLVAQTTRLEVSNQALQQEIAERNRVERAQQRTLRSLQEANQELDDFAYIIAHDLKAPFRAVGSLTSWLLSDYAAQLEADGQDLVRLLHGRADRLNALIESLLQYTRVSRVNEALQEVDLNRLVTRVMRALAPPETIEITLDTPLPTIRFDPKRAEQLFHSLLDNAVRFMDKTQGIVRVALVSDQGAWWHLCIADNGPGIENIYFEKIFKVFQTLQARDTVETSWMGLALARKIVSKFGGRIWVDATVGEGSTFHFTLPKHPEEP